MASIPSEENQDGWDNQPIMPSDQAWRESTAGTSGSGSRRLPEPRSNAQRLIPTQRLEDLT